jgi:chromosome segregation ATPase
MSIQELERKIDRKKEEIAETEELIESLKGKLKRAKGKAKNSHGNQINFASGSATIFVSYNGRSSDPQKDVERLERKISQLKDILRDEKCELKRLETELDFERKKARDKKKSNNNGSSGGGFFGGLFGGGSGGSSSSGGFFHW